MRIKVANQVRIVKKIIKFTLNLTCLIYLSENKVVSILRLKSVNSS